VIECDFSYKFSAPALHAYSNVHVASYRITCHTTTIHQTLTAVCQGTRCDCSANRRTRTTCTT